MAAARRIAAAALLGRTQVATALRAGAARQPAFTSTQRRQHTTGSGSRAAAAAVVVAATATGVASCDESVIAQWEAKQGEHAWLEEVEGERALAFAKSENAKTEEALGDPTATIANVPGDSAPCETRSASRRPEG